MTQNAVWHTNLAGIWTANMFNGGDAVTYCRFRPLSYMVSAGSLPAGLQLSAVDGTISGTPITPSTASSVTILSQNVNSTVLQTSLKVEVKPISLAYTLPLPGRASFTMGLPLTLKAIVTPSNGANSFSIDKSLPKGLMLNTTTGDVKGIPAVSSAAAIYIVTARNKGGGVANATISIVISPDSRTKDFEAIKKSNAFTLNLELPIMGASLASTALLVFCDYLAWRKRKAALDAKALAVLEQPHFFAPLSALVGVCDTIGDVQFAILASQLSSYDLLGKIAIVFTVLPQVVSIVAVVLTLRELRRSKPEVQTWMQGNYPILIIVVLLCGSNYVYLTLLFCNVWRLKGFAAPVSKQWQDLIFARGLLTHVVEDIPQLALQILVVITEYRIGNPVAWTAYLAMGFSASVLVLNIIRRCLMYGLLTSSGMEDENSAKQVFSDSSGSAAKSVKSEGKSDVSRMNSAKGRTEKSRKSLNTSAVTNPLFEATAPPSDEGRRMIQLPTTDKAPLTLARCSEPPATTDVAPGSRTGSSKVDVLLTSSRTSSADSSRTRQPPPLPLVMSQVKNKSDTLTKDAIVKA